MNLRPYQLNDVTRIRQAFLTDQRVCYVLPTGGGKTTAFCYIAAAAQGKGTRTWIVAHRQELTKQGSNTLNRFNVPHGMIQAGSPMTDHMTQVCSLQTVVGRIGKVAPPDFIIFDECHHATSGSYKKIMEAYPLARILGVTATPCRTDGKGLGEVFTNMIMGPTTKQLTEAGYLSPARYFAPPVVADLAGVKRRGGDYAREQLEEVMQSNVITGDAVDHYRRICDGVPMIVFCVSIQHAKDVAQAYCAAGYAATHVDGQLTDEERAYRLDGLGNGTFQVITSCDLIGEGLDIPSVVAAQLLRPTESTSLHLQQIGRALRPSEGKESAIILDHVGNTLKHGMATSDREWSLDGLKRKTRAKIEDDVVIQTCPECYGVHEPAPICPYCGFERPVKDRVIKHSKGELKEIQEAMMKFRKEQDKKALTVQELIQLGKERGYKNPEFWAKMKMKGRTKWARK